MMKTLELSTVDQMNCFPDMQSVKYNVLDKVEQITQGRYRVNFEYGYDNQRMSMTKVDNIANATYTKDYVGNCEFIDNNGNDEVRTYLAGPAGVFAVVVQKGNTTNIDYVYKDNLGSWTTIADSTKRVVERMSYDAWGNLRDATTWCGNFGRLPKYERGFTGHEHLYEFGLINMNGRMYDPMSASFLSPDSYIQDPTTQQGFNRYAYCAYNPLKYVDPSGYRYYGYDEGAYYRMIDEMTRTIQREWHLVYESAMESAQLTISMACGLYSHGLDTHGNGSGNHGSPGGGGQNGPNNKPLIFIRSYITDNDSPIYQFVIYNTDESSGDNTSYFSELKKFTKENTSYFFIDGAAALDFMYENSFDENMNAYKEISAWVVDGGIIVLPWDNNTERVSMNDRNKIGDNYFYEFEGHSYEIRAQIHTHPNYNNGDIGVSSFDMNMTEIRPVYIIYNSSLYKAGNPTIRLDQTRNINYYNWRNYIKY